MSTRRTIDVHGRSTEVLVTGRGEPLVYQHGGGILEGHDFLEAWSDRFQVFAPLAPGYGATAAEPPLTGKDSVAEHLAGVLEELDIERAVVVGHSLGGWMAAGFAARYPERVSELVLAAPLGMDVPEHPVANMLALSPAERLATLTNDLTIYDGRLPTGPDPDFQAARAREQAALQHFAPRGADPDLAETTSRLVGPTHLLWGEGDRLIPVAHVDHWQRAIPQATVRTFRGVGHTLFAESADARAAVVASVGSGRG